MARRRHGRRFGSPPGSIFLNGNRYWWRIRLPGDDRRRAFPLRPPGARYATDDPAVAEEIAWNLLHAAQRAAEGSDVDPADRRVAALADAYVAFARQTYRGPDGQPSGEVEKIRLALRHVRDACGAMQAELVGPLDLKAVRETMIDADLSRTTINQRVSIIKRMYRWAASEQRVPASCYQALATVEGLRRGRSEAREGRDVGPVAEHWVEATCEALPPTVAAMVRCQLLTGMRSGELCRMRPCEIERSGRIWTYRPEHHKTERHGHRREVLIGPKAQRLLRPLLRGRELGAYVFSPAEAREERYAAMRAARKSKIQPSQRDRRKAKPLRGPGASYDAGSYHRAIVYAIAKANRARASEGLPEIPHWHPHQLRHAAATRIRKEIGLEAARAVLGQRSLAIADTYAELDRGVAADAVKRMG